MEVLAMDEVLDVYSDQLQINTSAFGATLNFMTSKPTPPAPGSPPETIRLATVRMSIEHLKIMTYLLRRQIVMQESETGVLYDIPRQVLNGMGISPEDWETFWKRK